MSEWRLLFFGEKGTRLFHAVLAFEKWSDEKHPVDDSVKLTVVLSSMELTGWHAYLDTGHVWLAG